MEENLNTAENPSKGKQKNYHLTLEESISRMKLAFANAKLPEINPQLAVLGYNEAKLNELLSKVTELETLHQKQKKGIRRAVRRNQQGRGKTQSN